MNETKKQRLIKEGKQQILQDRMYYYDLDLPLLPTPT